MRHIWGKFSYLQLHKNQIRYITHTFYRTETDGNPSASVKNSALSYMWKNVKCISTLWNFGVNVRFSFLGDTWT